MLTVFLASFGAMLWSSYKNRIRCDTTEGEREVSFASQNSNFVSRARYAG